MWLDTHSIQLQGRYFHPSIPAPCANIPRSVSSISSSHPHYFGAITWTYILFYCCICLQPWYWFIQWLPRFFILPFRLCFIFGLPAYLFGSIIPKKLAMGFMRTAASTFFYTWDVFLGCLLIPPTSDLTIVEVVIVASLCLVPMKTPFKMKASLQNEGAKSFQAK